MSFIPGTQRLSDVRRRFGTITALKDLAYRIIRKALRFELYRVMVIKAASEAVDYGDLECRRLADEVQRFCINSANVMETALCRRLDSGLDFCCGAIAGDELMNYSWFAVDSIEGDHSMTSGV